MAITLNNNLLFSNLEYGSKRFGCTKDDVKNVIKRFGCMKDDVKKVITSRINNIVKVEKANEKVSKKKLTKGRVQFYVWGQL